MVPIQQSTTTPCSSLYREKHSQVHSVDFKALRYLALSRVKWRLMGNSSTIDSNEKEMNKQENKVLRIIHSYGELAISKKQKQLGDNLLKSNSKSFNGQKGEHCNNASNCQEARSSFTRRRKEWKDKNCFSLSDLRQIKHMHHNFNKQDDQDERSENYNKKNANNSKQSLEQSIVASQSTQIIPFPSKFQLENAKLFIKQHQHVLSERHSQSTRKDSYKQVTESQEERFQSLSDRQEYAIEQFCYQSQKRPWITASLPFQHSNYQRNKNSKQPTKDSFVNNNSVSPSMFTTTASSGEFAADWDNLKDSVLDDRHKRDISDSNSSVKIKRECSKTFKISQQQSQISIQTRYRSFAESALLSNLQLQDLKNDNKTTIKYQSRENKAKIDPADRFRLLKVVSSATEAVKESRSLKEILPSLKLQARISERNHGYQTLQQILEERRSPAQLAQEMIASDQKTPEEEEQCLQEVETVRAEYYQKNKVRNVEKREKLRIPKNHLFNRNEDLQDSILGINSEESHRRRRINRKKLVSSLLVLLLKIIKLNLSLFEVCENKLFSDKQLIRPCEKLFFLAVKNNDLSAAYSYLRDDKYLVFSRDKLFQTPLHWASKRGYSDLVKLLLSSSADVDAKDIFGRTSLFYSLKWRNQLVSLILLKYKACPWSDRNNDILSQVQEFENPLISSAYRISKKAHLMIVISGPKDRKFLWNEFQLDIDLLKSQL